MDSAVNWLIIEFIRETTQTVHFVDIEADGSALCLCKFQTGPYSEPHKSS